MRRSNLDQAAAILTATTENPKRSPTQIFGYIGINYKFLKPLMIAGLIQIHRKNKRNRLILTDKGREFIVHYKICEKLFQPS